MEKQIIFVKHAKFAPRSTRLWPKVEKIGYELVFKPYGPNGPGFYLIEI